MKSLKIVLVTLFFVGSAVIISSFIIKDFPSNEFAEICYEYTIDSRDNLLKTAVDFVQEASFKNKANWVTVDQHDCIPTTYICQLCFEATQLVNGVTLQGILNALFDQKINLSIIPTSGVPFNLTVAGQAVTVTVYLQND